MTGSGGTVGESLGPDGWVALPRVCPRLGKGPRVLCSVSAWETWDCHGRHETGLLGHIPSLLGHLQLWVWEGRVFLRFVRTLQTRKKSQ